MFFWGARSVVVLRRYGFGCDLVWGLRPAADDDASGPTRKLIPSFSCSTQAPKGASGTTKVHADQQLTRHTGPIFVHHIPPVPKLLPNKLITNLCDVEITLRSQKLIAPEAQITSK